ncbi:MAG: hypothetical protein M3522_09025 [Actinomycetota bacterium]|nr:hypothetical protein [Actinomycetota bacterium]
MPYFMVQKEGESKEWKLAGVYFAPDALQAIRYAAGEAEDSDSWCARQVAGEVTYARVTGRASVVNVTEETAPIL